VHLHHMVVGIVIVLTTGIVCVATWPTGIGREIIGICFGIGSALTLDEFALSLYLKDVYWSPEGRSSVDATVAGVMLAGLLMVGISPFGVADPHETRTMMFSVVALNVPLAVVTFLKGKLMLGLISIFVPFVGLMGVMRLAKPRSPWGRWFYKRDEHKHERAYSRYEADRGWGVRFNTWFTDLIGGSPSKASPTD
jgi:hypothetical protein